MNRLSLLLLVALVALAGCGGGDPEPEEPAEHVCPDVPTPRVPCDTQPELCQ